MPAQPAPHVVNARVARQQVVEFAAGFANRADCPTANANSLAEFFGSENHAIFFGDRRHFIAR